MVQTSLRKRQSHPKFERKIFLLKFDTIDFNKFQHTNVDCPWENRGEIFRDFRDGVSSESDLEVVVPIDDIG